MIVYWLITESNHRLCALAVHLSTWHHCLQCFECAFANALINRSMCVVEKSLNDICEAKLKCLHRFLRAKLTSAEDSDTFHDCRLPTSYRSQDWQHCSEMKADPSEEHLGFYSHTFHEASFSEVLQSSTFNNLSYREPICYQDFHHKASAAFAEHTRFCPRLKTLTGCVGERGKTLHLRSFLIILSAL